jgi:hypothetical protein
MHGQKNIKSRLFVCKAVRLTSERSGQQMCGIGCPGSMGRGTPYALVGVTAKSLMSTAAVMCRFTLGSLSRVKFGWRRVLQTDRQTDMAKLIGDFCGLLIFAVKGLEFFDVHTFRCAYI